MPVVSEFTKMMNVFTMFGASMVALVFMVAVVAWSCEKMGHQWLHPRLGGYVRVRQHVH